MMLLLARGTCLVFATLLALTSALPPHDPSAHPTLLARTGGPRERACFHRFHACHLRGVDLTRERQRLQSQDEHLTHVLDKYERIFRGQECGQRNKIYQSYLDDTYGRKREEQAATRFARASSTTEGPASTTADSETATSTDPSTEASSTTESSTTGSSAATANNPGGVPPQQYNSTSTEYCQKEIDCVANARAYEREIAQQREFLAQKERSVKEYQTNIALCAYQHHPREPDSKRSVRHAKRRTHPDINAMRQEISGWVSSCNTQLAAIRRKEQKMKDMREQADLFVANDIVAGTPRARIRDTPLVVDGSEGQIATNDTQIFNMGRRSSKDEFEKPLAIEFGRWEHCRDEITYSQGNLHDEFANLKDSMDRYMFQLEPTNLLKHKRQPSVVSHEESVVNHESSKPEKPAVPTVFRRHKADVIKMWEYVFRDHAMVADFWKDKYSELFMITVDQMETLYRQKIQIAEYIRARQRRKAKEEEERSRSTTAAVRVAPTSMASTATCDDNAAMVTALQVQISQASVISSLQAELSRQGTTPASSVAIQTTAAKPTVPSTYSATVSPALHASAAEYNALQRVAPATAAAVPLSEARSTSLSSTATDKAPVQASQKLSPAPTGEAAAIDKSISAAPATPALTTLMVLS